MPYKNKNKQKAYWKQWYKANKERKKLIAQKHHKKHPDDRWKRKLKWKYGITTDDYFLLEQKQNYKCAICGNSNIGRLTSKKWNVDHNHKTKKLRGLLCHHCNVILGHVKDDYQLLLKAIEYLKLYE